MELQAPEIVDFAGVLLVGMRTQLSHAEDATGALWARFMPVRHTIPFVRGTDLYSVEVYPGPSFFENFNPGRTYEKWAAVAVDPSCEPLPPGMEERRVPGGLYGVFSYRGRPSESGALYRHIYSEWLAHADYELDDRPHFALMGDGYKGEDPDSEEEIWIPLRKK